MLKSLLSILLLFTGLISCSQSNNDCSFLPGFKSDNTECGFLTVPENRSKSNSKTIQIAYAVLKAKSKSPAADPIIFLQGGPGGSGIDLYNFWSNHPLRSKRDIVLIDQRGTGRSVPAMCSDFGKQFISVLSQNLDLEGEKEAMRPLIQSCKRQLLDQGVDLEAYNSKENAADVEALRQHLGYGTWNIWGGSYGSRLGLTLMRDYPESVRSSILSGPFPPNVNLYASLLPNFKLSLSEVFEQCKNDKQCNAKYPSLEKDFYASIQRLKTDPIKLKRRGEDFWLNSQDVLLLTHQLLYSRNTISEVPALFKAIEDQDHDQILTSLESLFQRAGGLSYGMYFSVQAYEELPFNDYKTYQNGLIQTAKLSPGLAFFSSDIQLLDQWHNSRALALENKAVTSSIPTLITVGEFDPITPPWFGEKTLETLENGQIAVFPGNGHGIFNTCASDMMEEFLQNPLDKIDKGCLASIKTIRFK